MPKLDEMNFLLAREACVGLCYVLRRQMRIDASVALVSCRVD